MPDTWGGAGASVHFSFAVIEVLSRGGYGSLVGQGFVQIMRELPRERCMAPRVRWI